VAVSGSTGPGCTKPSSATLLNARSRGHAVEVIQIRKIGSSDSRNADPEPEAGEAEWRLWAERPDRIRAEFGVVEDWITAVFRGDAWWSWAPSRGGARTNGGRQDVGHAKGPGWDFVDTAA
jgi:hypothetical protein